MKKAFVLLLLINICGAVSAQRIIKGQVKDAADEASLPGVTIQVKGSNNATITDLDGNYTISVDPNASELVFSYLGMKTQTVKIGNKSVINVSMAQDTQELGEVVVTALGIKREAKALSSSQQRVNTSVLAEVQNQNLIASLSGKVAGVQITPPQSATASARIVIRGNSSLTGNNQPLFVVDGIAMDNTVSEIGGDGSTLDMGNSTSFLNPEDIESMDILKGPNAAALYGSRAANGVVLITTKSAKEGRVKLSVNSNTMFRYISQYPDFQNTFGVGSTFRFIGTDRQYLTEIDGLQYPDMRLNQQSHRSWGAPMLGQEYIGLDGEIHRYLPQENNIYDFYRTARMLTNNASIEGGTKDNNYRVSFTNMSSDDIVSGINKVNKNTINARFFNTLTRKMSLDSKFMYASDETKNRQHLNGSSFNPMYAYLFMPRSLDLNQIKSYKNDEGREQGKIGDGHNPYWSINENHNKDHTTKVLVNFDFNYQIFQFLRLSLKYGKDYNYMRSYEFRNSGAAGSGDDMRGYYSEKSNNADNDTYELMLMFDKRIKDFSVIANYGMSRVNFYRWETQGTIRSIKQPGFAHISNSDDYPEATERHEKKRVNSMYGFLSLGYKGWIYLDVTGRNDWSSALPAANNSYFYPSFGFSWIASEMLKIPQSVFYGKLRGSYAIVGNDTYPYRLIPYYSFNTIYNDYTYATLPGDLPNANLKPEKTYSYEIGADLRFLNGRINLDLTYYNSRSKDQIINGAMIPSSGYSNKVFNAGTIENKGVELAANVIPVKTRNFTYELNANFTKNKSLVVSLPEGKPIRIREQFDTRIYLEEGKPYGVIRGRTWMTDKDGKRLVESTGKAKFTDTEQELGTAQPDWLMGISNTFRYKDFDLYFLIDIKKGGKLYSVSRRKGITAGVFSGMEAEMHDYWYRKMIIGDGDGRDLYGGYRFDDTYYAVATGEFDEFGKEIFVAGEKCDLYISPQDVGFYSDNFSDMNFFDATYVKLRELSVGYNLPAKWIKKISLSSARVSLVGRNLWIIHQKTPNGLDPEAADNAGNAQGFENGGLPPSTTLGFDIKLSF